jgi:hypothetical protein
VSQISPPIRVLLVCAVAFLGAWMLFLRPKDEAIPPAETATPPNTQTSEPAVSGPGKAVEAAQEAVAAANGEQTGEAATASTPKAQKPAQGAAATAAGAGDLKGVPKSVRKAIRGNDVVVLLFWNREASDDRAVRAALRKVDRWDGRVHVEAASIKTISRYGRITRGADVEQSPTVVVVDPELHVETLVGYADTATIDQLVVDALRNTTGLFTSSYLREVNDLCRRYGDSMWAKSGPESGREAAGWFKTTKASFGRYAGEFKKLKAPKRHAAFKRAVLADHAAYAALIAEWSAFLGPNPTPTRALASLDRFARREVRVVRRYERRMDDKHVLSCGSDL